MFIHPRIKDDPYIGDPLLFEDIRKERSFVLGRLFPVDPPERISRPIFPNAQKSAPDAVLPRRRLPREASCSRRVNRRIAQRPVLRADKNRRMRFESLDE